MQNVQYTHFYSYCELASFLEEAARAYPRYVKLESLAETVEGRSIFVIKITDFETENPEARAAYYVQGGLHAEEGAGTTAALSLVEALLTHPEKRAILHDVIFYIVPRVNPDGSEYAIEQCGVIRSAYLKSENIGNTLSPKDLDGDGFVLQMRTENPLGRYVEYQNTGIMLARTAEDIGPFYDVYTEGLFDTFDGGDVKSANRSIDFNRSYPASWRPMEYSEDYPFRGIETRAVAEFMVSHRNIFACIDYHCGSGGILRPLMSGDETLCESDRHLIQDVGALGAEISGLPLIHERAYKEPDADPDVPYGCTNEWAYHALGISSYVIELGNGFTGIGLTTQEILTNWRNVENGPWLKRILEKHQAAGSALLVPWHSFCHPQLGNVEIGGLKNGMAYYMLPNDMKAVIPRTTQFLLRHAEMHPRLVLDNIALLHIADEVWRVRADCMNIGAFG
ncbi:MAG: M14 family zinc carboxypeptidase, partial [Ruthenibacterium sp.]